MKLESFEREVMRLLGDATDQRPFVCSGSPLDCEVFVVGFNPASRLKTTSFWDYWSSTGGFDRERWIRDYIDERQRQAAARGKRRNRLSATRNRLEQFVASMAPVSVLETNIFTRATPRAEDLAAEYRDPSVFSFLLDSIKPRLLIVHGKGTEAALRKLPAWQRRTAAAWFFPHLASRGGQWNREKIAEVGLEVREFIEAAQQSVAPDGPGPASAEEN